MTVDDDAVILELMGEILSLEGHNVRAFPNAVAAWSFISTTSLPIGLLLTDARMPGAFGGSELAKLTNELNPNIPIVLTSGYMDEFDSVHPTYVKFLPKPWSLNQLVEAFSVAAVSLEAVSAHPTESYKRG